MAGNKLDPIDRRILAELQADGRMTNVELASRVGLSAAPCWRRVRALEEAGFILGYRAELDRWLGTISQTISASVLIAAFSFVAFIAFAIVAAVFEVSSSFKF